VQLISEDTKSKLKEIEAFCHIIHEEIQTQRRSGSPISQSVDALSAELVHLQIQVKELQLLIAHPKPEFKKSGS
jgi:flagellar biosynthesis chaperone FliJ